jgi:uncharacterized protein YbaR (Trm112 family)
MMMRQAPKKIPFCCPLCKTSLKLNQRGLLFCPVCRLYYPFKEGVPYLLPTEEKTFSSHFNFAGVDVVKLARKESSRKITEKSKKPFLKTTGSL